MSTSTLLITGASSDLAAALLRRLSEEQSVSRVIAHFHQSRNRVEALRAVFPGEIFLAQADLSLPQDVDGFIEQIRSQPAVPDKIVHFAGLNLRLERFSQADVPRFQQDLAVQVTAIARILREFLPAMARLETRSRIVFVLSSVTLGTPPKFMPLYTVVKYAQLGLMRALAAEFAGTRISINAVSPSMVETRFLSEIPAKAIEMAAAQSPQHRNVATDEVAAAIQFLLSSRSDDMQGVNLPVTAGAEYPA
jgi:3-oxoacyl-[acyl-carrier protein] reductase